MGNRLHPMECADMSALWNWETCLPVSKRHPAVTTPSQKPGNRAGSAPNQGRKPQQSCMIKAYQGIRKKTIRPLGRFVFGASPPHPLCVFASQRLCVKTPAIKANRASSRQTPKNEYGHLFSQPTRTVGRTGRRKAKPWHRRPKHHITRERYRVSKRLW